MIATGTTLQQRYKIDKQIGQGGMGAVYVATDERFGSTVAIKETLCMDDNFRKAIEREARLLNSLKHSALPRVSDHFEENDGMFLVMEYIPGDDVAAMLEDENAAFTVEQVLNWAHELLDALDYLHNQEMPVIHRDIKPQNLKINSRGQMILLDFGLAKGNPTDASHQTAAKSIFGYSRSYASLEQIQGTGTDPRSDLYSLAATLYHMLTRIPPEDALTRAMSVLSQRPDPLVPASTVNSAVPRGLAGVLQKAMDLNAGQRPSSAAEMRQMFRESENYAHLVDDVTIAAIASGPQVFAQPTRLMPEMTKPIFSDPDAKTEVYPGFASQVTSVRAGETDGTTSIGSPPPPPVSRGSGRAVAAGAVLMLLVGVIAVSGVYFINPSVFSVAGEKAPETPDATSPLTVDSVTTTADSTTGLANTVSSQKLVESGGEADKAKILADEARPAQSEKPVETTKNSTKTAASSQATNAADADGETMDIQIDDPDLPNGGIVITDRDENGKVTRMRVNPTGKNPNMRNPGDYQVPPGSFDMRHLTPVQRQKLQRVLRNNPPFRPIPPPSPRP